LPKFKTVTPASLWRAGIFRRGPARENGDERSKMVENGIVSPAREIDIADRIGASPFGTYYGQWPPSFARESEAKIAVHCP
jgi:hypothetical protein